MADNTKQCPEFAHFGAHYPDARCIEGYLWDLDKCDERGLYGGGDDPCPFCNAEEYKDWLGWEDADETRRDGIVKHMEILKQSYQPVKEAGGNGGQ